MTSNKDYLSYLYNTLDVPDTVEREKIISDVLKTFSAYITNYDNDYLYNYKFIVSHIEDFIKSWNKSIYISYDCEKIKDILLSNENITAFCKFISQNPDTELSILVNEAIEIHSSSNIDILSVKRKKTLSSKSILYKDEIDMQIRLVFNTKEFRKDFKKKVISELINNKDSSNISIVAIIEELIKDFFYYIINFNDLSLLIEALKIIEYNQNNAEDIYIQFDDFLEYYPFRETKNLGNAYIFRFHENNTEELKIKNIYIRNVSNTKFPIKPDYNYIEQLYKFFNSKEGYNYEKPT